MYVNKLYRLKQSMSTAPTASQHMQEANASPVTASPRSLPAAEETAGGVFEPAAGTSAAPPAPAAHAQLNEGLDRPPPLIGRYGAADSAPSVPHAPFRLSGTTQVAPFTMPSATGRGQGGSGAAGHVRTQLPVNKPLPPGQTLTNASGSSKFSSPRHHAPSGGTARQGTAPEVPSGPLGAAAAPRGPSPFAKSRVANFFQETTVVGSHRLKHTTTEVSAYQMMQQNRSVSPSPLQPQPLGSPKHAVLPVLDDSVRATSASGTPPNLPQLVALRRSYSAGRAASPARCGAGQDRPPATLYVLQCEYA